MIRLTASLSLDTVIVFNPKEIVCPVTLLVFVSVTLVALTAIGASAAGAKVIGVATVVVVPSAASSTL